MVFPYPHLLGVAGLEPEHVETILARANQHAEANARREKVASSLSGKTLINLFFEPSTRTQASFELAAKRLGATVMNMSIARSSMTKGETLLDTATTLNSMLPDILVVRHQHSGAVALLAEKVNCGVVNAGDGWHEHPTQALLDALTMLRAFKDRRGADSLKGLTVTICGDVTHSRVARSNIHLHKLLGNTVRVVGPATVLPSGLDGMGVEAFTSMEEGVKDADVVMMLRLQNERMDGAFIPSTREYFHVYGLDEAALRHAKPDALVMHPGPMNRGVEIDSELADHPDRSMISTQVEMGVAVRMAVLELVAENLPHTAKRSDGVMGAAPKRRFFGSAAAPRAPERMLIRNAQIIDPEGQAPKRGSVLIEGRIIKEISPDISAPNESGAEIVDANGAALAPGLVDMRVFIGEPGERHKESFASGGEAAVAGGVTTIVTQPETHPPVDDPALFDFIAQRVAAEAVDHAMPNVRTMGALTKGLKGAQMAEYGFLVEAGAVGLTDGDRPVANALVFRRCLEYAAALGVLVAHHPQHPALSAGACATEGEIATRLGLPSAPAEAESIMLSRDLSLVALTHARYHASQISTAASLDAVRAAKAQGLSVSAAVSAPHFTFSEEDLADYRTFFKMDPPLRTPADRDAMLDGLADGTIDCIISNHRPQSEESKRVPFAQAAAGAVGVETLLSASLKLVEEKRLTLPQLFEKLALNPAKLLGLDTGRMKKGAPADLTLFAPDARRQVFRRRLRSKAKNSPFDKAELRGVTLETYVQGRRVFINDGAREAGL